MDTPPLDNRTKLAIHPQAMIGKRGELLTVAIKATYELSPTTLQLELAPKDRRRGIRLGDIPWGKPESSSIKYPGDLAPAKPGTDVVVVGKAYPPPETPVTSFKVFAKIGDLGSALVVHGLRVWDTNGSAISPAQPAKPIELRYEYAWGGRDESDPARLFEEARNPVGRGVAGNSKQLTGKLAPCIEYADVPIKNAKTRPHPAGFGAVARHWEPRRGFAGTYDEPWKENRAPLIPDDEDDHIHCFASRDLHADVPLVGIEAVGLLNLLPEGRAAQFALPGVGVEVEFRIKGREPELLRPHLDTVIVDTLGVEQGLPLTVELLWHASTKAPRRVLDSNTIVRGIRPT